MFVSIVTAILNLMIAFRIISFTNNSKSHKQCTFYTAIAVVIVAISFESALTIIFIGERVDHGELLGTLLVAGIVFSVRGDIGRLFYLLSDLRNGKVH